MGYPNEHLAGDSDGDITSPLYATAVGLVLDGLERQEKQVYIEDTTSDKETPVPPVEKPPVRSKRIFREINRTCEDFLENAE